MVNRVNNREERKVWSAPEVKRLRAGSAEAGTNATPDGGPAGNARS